MNFREKKPLHTALKGAQYLEADTALLKAKDPENKALKFKFKGDRLQAEILYILLDFATRDEIVHNRRGVMKEEAQKHEIENLIVKLKASDNEVPAKELFAKITELIVKMPQADREALSAATLEAMPNTEDLKGAEYAEAKKALDNIDFDKPKEIPIELVDKLVKKFDVQVKGKKKENKLKALLNLREALSGFSENSQSQSEKENLQDKVEELEEKNEELKDKLDEKDEELEKKSAAER